jgi:hypothetical protein
MQLPISQHDFEILITNRIRFCEDSDEICRFAEAILGLPDASVEYDPHTLTYQVFLPGNSLTRWFSLGEIKRYMLREVADSQMDLFEKRDGQQ